MEENSQSSLETKKLQIFKYVLLLLLLIVVFPIGVIVMWLWFKKWPLLAKILLTILPLLAFISSLQLYPYIARLEADWKYMDLKDDNYQLKMQIKNPNQQTGVTMSPSFTNRQNNTTATPPQIFSLTNIPVVPTQSPTLTANWKTYTNVKWGVSFKYPETWFPQEAPKSSQQGDAVNFYPNGVTPDPGGGGETPYNFVFSVNYRDWRKQTNEQFISDARGMSGKRVLNVAGGPAIRGDGYNHEWYYIIKLSNTSELLFAPYNDDATKSLDTIILTLKITN